MFFDLTAALKIEPDQVPIHTLFDSEKKNKKRQLSKKQTVLFPSRIFLVGATTLNCFVKAYKASETQGFFRYKWLDNQNKFDIPELPPYESFSVNFKSTIL